MPLKKLEVTPSWRPGALHALTTKIQEAQTLAGKLGLLITGHTLNNAQNALGWEQQGEIEQAAAASKGVRPGET